MHLCYWRQCFWVEDRATTETDVLCYVAKGPFIFFAHDRLSLLNVIVSHRIAIEGDERFVAIFSQWFTRILHRLRPLTVMVRNWICGISDQARRGALGNSLKLYTRSNNLLPLYPAVQQRRVSSEFVFGQRSQKICKYKTRDYDRVSEMVKYWLAHQPCWT